MSLERFDLTAVAQDRVLVLPVASLAMSSAAHKPPTDGELSGGFPLKLQRCCAVE
jgi:hypothetical protein